MARDPYQVLGVAPTAADADIRAAFRKLAKEHHPDRNKGDKKAEERFKEISGAFDILGDADRRKKFDRGEIDADGRERAAQFHHRPWPGAAGAAGPGREGDDLSDIFADLFGARGGRGFGGAGLKGRDVKYKVEVDFVEAARGAKKRVAMPDGRTLDIAVPAGIEDGQTLRLKGQGEPAPGGAGDAHVEVAVLPHPLFTRDGLDIHMEAAISLKEAVLGGKITVPTISGDVAVQVPRWSSSGATLRLKGRGVALGTASVGDQYVKLKIVLPDGGDRALEEFVRSWAGGAAVRFADA